MRPLASSFAACLVAWLVVSCAASGPAPRPGRGEGDSLTSLTDSLEAAAYDDIFIEKHTSVLKELAARENVSRPDTRLIEARSLVSASEELYLKGMFDAAIRLLDEAARTLRQDR